MATLFSKTIDFDQPFQRFFFVKKVEKWKKKNISQNPPKIDTFYHNGVK